MINNIERKIYIYIDEYILYTHTNIHIPPLLTWTRCPRISPAVSALSAPPLGTKTEPIFGVCWELWDVSVEHLEILGHFQVTCPCRA